MTETAPSYGNDERERLMAANAQLRRANKTLTETIVDAEILVLAARRQKACLLEDVALLRRTLRFVIENRLGLLDEIDERTGIRFVKAVRLAEYKAIDLPVDVAAMLAIVERELDLDAVVAS